jgi:hypothetical protein
MGLSLISEEIFNGISLFGHSSYDGNRRYLFSGFGRGRGFTQGPVVKIKKHDFYGKRINHRLKSGFIIPALAIAGRRDWSRFEGSTHQTAVLGSSFRTRPLFPDRAAGA